MSNPITDSEHSSVHFPGAVKSKFTTHLSFARPDTLPAMPTYRVMDSDGVIVDKTRKATEISNEEVITWYKNMLTGQPKTGSWVAVVSIC
jgi:2-oxoisovalerate dehydrogenase E1 component alpha subunit